MDSDRKARLKKSDIGYGYDSAFPKRLRYLLESENITQDLLAEYLGISRQSVAQWKDGKTKPDIYYLDKVADFFEVSTDYLLGRTEDFSGNADVMAVEKRLGLSPISQDMFETILQMKIHVKGGLPLYTDKFDVINLLLETEFLRELEIEMRKHIEQRHVIKYYEEKYGDIILIPFTGRNNMIDMTLERRLFDNYQEEVTKGEFYLFVAQQNVLKALRYISEQADKRFNMSEFINTPFGGLIAECVAANENLLKEEHEKMQKEIDKSSQRDLEMTEGMWGSSDVREGLLNGEHSKD